MPKFHWTTPPNSEDIRAPLLHFQPIFLPLFAKKLRETRIAGGGALARLGHSLARV